MIKSINLVLISHEVRKSSFTANILVLLCRFMAASLIFLPGGISKHRWSLIRLLGARDEMKIHRVRAWFNITQKKCQNRPQQPTKESVCCISPHRCVSDNPTSPSSELWTACWDMNQVVEEAQFFTLPHLFPKGSLKKYFCFDHPLH